jgi:acetyl esterase
VATVDAILSAAALVASMQDGPLYRLAMALDPALQALVDKGSSLPPLHTLPIAQARARAAQQVGPPAGTPASVENRMLRGPGGDLAIRIYRPHSAPPNPVAIFFHGSGFVVCNLDTHDGTCRNICTGADYVVVSVDYRLAPDAPFPAAPDDCLFAARWVGENAAEIGGDPERLVVVGDSAGGNLAAVTALQIRDEGGPRLIGQALIYPMLDHHSAERPSLSDNATGYGLSRDTIIWYWRQYLADDFDASSNPHAAPMRAADVSGLPPAFVVTAEFDPLRDDGEAYAARLRQAGVPVSAQRWLGANHGFIQWSGLIPLADDAMAALYHWLRRRAESVAVA